MPNEERRLRTHLGPGKVEDVGTVAMQFRLNYIGDDCEFRKEGAWVPTSHFWIRRKVFYLAHDFLCIVYLPHGNFMVLTSRRKERTVCIEGNSSNGTGVHFQSLRDNDLRKITRPVRARFTYFKKLKFFLSEELIQADDTHSSAKDRTVHPW